MQKGEAESMSCSNKLGSETLSETQEVQDALKEEDSSSSVAPASREPEPGKISVDLQMDYIQMLEVPLDHGLQGALRYRRESQKRTISLQPQPPTDGSPWCEFCGTRAKPPLDSVQEKEPKEFCCLRYREVFEEVAQERRFVLELCEEKPSETMRIRHNNRSVEEEMELGAKERASKESRLQQKEMERFYKEAQARLAHENSFLHTSTTFQLSACVPVDEDSTVKKSATNEEKPSLLEWHNPSGSGPSGFGLNHQRVTDDACFVQKFYSNGNKFLTSFPDGSSQVFYPSGNLAIILFTSESESVCVVHDDLAPHRPIRALFQSGGRATCYHADGRVWLNLHTWGGQSLDEGGIRTRRWNWSDHTQTPVPFRPIFLSLNKYVGVRVLGRRSVFLSFLALGQQARFSVGSGVKTGEGGSTPRGPSLSEEELTLLACRLYLRLTLDRLRWCHRFSSSPRHRNIRPNPVMLSLARKLLSASHSVSMIDSDRAFIQHCLEGFQ